MKTIGFLAALGSALLFVHAASASDTVEPKTNDVQWFVHHGAAFGKGYGGVLTGGTVLFRNDTLAGGASFEASGLFATRFGAAATGGLSLRDPSGFGFDLLGAFGVHRYDGVGRGVLSDDPGAGGTLPFAGARMRGVYVFGKGKNHFQLGLGGTLDHDIGQITRRYSYTETPWLDLFGNAKPQTKSAEQQIGFTTVGVMIDAGMTFDAL